MFLKRSAIIILLVNYCAFLFSQNIIYSREYAALKNNIPLQILNNNAGYFYLLRYNKPVNEFVIERRSKPEARILSFTPLKLDSVNATWFDYENLDYIFFECGNRICFMFEKVLNTKRTIYIKTVDTLGCSGGFKELAVLDREEGAVDFRFQFKITGHNKLLIVGEQLYTNHTSKKAALLYDLEKSENTWVKKLPLENYLTGFSQTFECDSANNLYYMLEHRSVAGYKRKYLDNVQMNVPVLSYDSLFLACMPGSSKTVLQRRIGLRDSTGIKSISLVPHSSCITVIVNGNRQNEQEYGQVFFMTQTFSCDFQKEVNLAITPLSEEVKKKLTFYDGTDDNSPADKDYNSIEIIKSGKYAYAAAGRADGSYYKDLLLWKTDLESGKVVAQQVVPRKVFYLKGSSRFKNIGEAGLTVCNGSFYALVLENRNNRHTGATEFRFNKFSKQCSAAGGNLAAYILKQDNNFEKKEAYRSIAFNFVAIKYQGRQDDFIFYLNKGKKEKFAILSLEQL